MNATINLEKLSDVLSEEFELDPSVVIKVLKDFVERGKPKKAVPGELILVLGYSERAHGLFGDTKTISSKLLAANQEKKKIFAYNKNLAFGPGWIIPSKHLKAAREALEEISDFKVRDISRDDYEKEVNGADQNIEQVEKPKAPVKTPAKSAKAPSKTT